MKVHECEQGTIEWKMLRAGKPTASELHRILTPTGKPSKQSEDYMCRLIAEYFLGVPIENEATQWMERGALLEDEAVTAYELQNECETAEVGFVTNDAETIGCSPDRLVGDAGLLEIKSPKPNTHVAYMLFGVLDADHYPQLQGQLYITGRKWVDIVSYHPDFPRVITRIERDEEYIAKLEVALNTFVDQMQKAIASLTEKYGDFKRKPEVPEEFISQEDVEAILKYQREHSER